MRRAAPRPSEAVKKLVRLKARVRRAGADSTLSEAHGDESDAHFDTQSDKSNAPSHTRALARRARAGADPEAHSRFSDDCREVEPGRQAAFGLSDSPGADA